jgi:hypothetical protein
MEAFVALDVPEVAPLLAAWSALMDLTSASAIGIRLVAVGAIITETCVVWAVLPADWSDTAESILAVIEAESSILFFSGSAVGKRLTRGTASSLLPA